MNSFKRSTYNFKKTCCVFDEKWVPFVCLKSQSKPIALILLSGSTTHVNHVETLLVKQPERERRPLTEGNRKRWHRETCYSTTLLPTGWYFPKIWKCILKNQDKLKMMIQLSVINNKTISLHNLTHNRLKFVDIWFTFVCIFDLWSYRR